MELPADFLSLGRGSVNNSGATDHISSSPTLFLLKDKNILLPPVMLPSEEKVKIVAKGSLLLNSLYYLRDILCVPTFKVDLMSVSHLTLPYKQYTCQTRKERNIFYN